MNRWFTLKLFFFLHLSLIASTEIYFCCHDTSMEAKGERLKISNNYIIIFEAHYNPVLFFFILFKHLLMENII